MYVLPPPPFAARPWAEIALPGDAERVPTMLTEEEGQLLFWLARDYAKGAGAIADLGCFAGGSTARLAAGVAAAGRKGPVLAYDHFTIQDHQKERYLYPAGVTPFEGRDMLPAVKGLLAPWQDIVTFKPGDLLQTGWPGGPIEILFVDAAKTPDAADGIAADFFPHLTPGRSVIVQQDYLHWRQPWVPAQMEMFADAVTPVAWCRQGTVAFLVTQEMSAQRIASGRVDGLEDQDLKRLLQRALYRFPDRPQKANLARAILGVTDNPGLRIPFKFDGSGINPDRIRAILQGSG